MTDILNDGWEQLTDEWQAPATPATPAARLRTHVQREDRKLALAMVLELALSMAAAVLIWGAWKQATVWGDRIVVLGLTVFSVRIWDFALANRRGTWRASGDTVEAFRALSRLRHGRQVAAARFTWRFSLVALPALLALVAWKWRTEGPMSASTLVAIAGATYLAACVAWGRHRERRLAATDTSWMEEGR